MRSFLKNHKWIKVLVMLVCILLILLVAALLFLKLWPAFGGRASAEDKQDYENRAENYHDGKFYNDGDFDFIMTDCAQYDVNWPEVHMFPEEAVQAAQILGAKAAMPIHWGAFTLTNHPWDDSAERFVAAGEEAGLQIVTPQIGETINLNSMESSMDRWWKDIL